MGLSLNKISDNCQQQKSFYFSLKSILYRVHVPCINDNHMPGEVIAGDSGLCYSVPVVRVTSIV